MKRRSIDVATVQRWQAIEAAARALIDAIDDSLDTKPWPQKYGVPFGAALALRQALDVRTFSGTLPDRKSR